MSAEYFKELFAKYRSKGVLIDSNILLLYFIGMYDPQRITTFKGTYSRGYTIDDFDILLRVFSSIKPIVTTPNILTEVSNLSNQLSGNEKQSCYSNWANQINLMTEEYIESQRICSFQHFKRFGLTDSGIIEMTRSKYLVLTDDYPLSGYLQKVGVDVLNFNHLRSVNWNV